MTTLGDVAAFVRSKNAGAFIYTFDIMYPDEQTYLFVTKSGAINTAQISSLYGVPEEDVKIFHFRPALATKVSIPRALSAGDPRDRDVAGGQQFAPILGIPIPATEGTH